MTWVDAPFYLIETVVIGARNAEGLARWYEEKLGMTRNLTLGEPIELRKSHTSQFPLAPKLVIASVPDSPLATAVTHHAVIFARDIMGSHSWFAARVPGTGEIQADSAGNSFFTFEDPEGNRIEVCREPDD